jgi:hypothetical protein
MGFQVAGLENPSPSATASFNDQLTGAAIRQNRL